MKERVIDEELTLVPYFPNESVTLPWYQDPQLCKQVDNRDSVYDLPLLRGMYQYLNTHGDLFYIQYRGTLCGDVTLYNSGEVSIVVAKEYQNLHIGRRVMQNIIALAREKNFPLLFAEVYSFNTQSQRMFEQVGFTKTADERYELSLRS